MIWRRPPLDPVGLIIGLTIIAKRHDLRKPTTRILVASFRLLIFPLSSTAAAAAAAAAAAVLTSLASFLHRRRDLLLHLPPRALPAPPPILPVPPGQPVLAHAHLKHPRVVLLQPAHPLHRGRTLPIVVLAATLLLKGLAPFQQKHPPALGLLLLLDDHQQLQLLQLAQPAEPLQRRKPPLCPLALLPRLFLPRRLLK